MTDLSGVEQLPQPDPRGWLALRYLPPEYQRLEDSTAAWDFDTRAYKPRGFTRPATPTEIALLEHLGHEIPPELVTSVKFYTKSCRNRRWPQIEAQEAAAS